MLVDFSIYFPGEFRKLLAAFVAGNTSKSGGLIRKITPTSAEPRGLPTTRSQQKLKVYCQQKCFNNTSVLQACNPCVSVHVL